MKRLRDLYTQARARWNEHFSSRWAEQTRQRMNTAIAKRQEATRRLEELVARGRT